MERPLRIEYPRALLPYNEPLEREKGPFFRSPDRKIFLVNFNSKAWHYGDHSAYRFKELREKMGLPRVGERILNKQRGSVWKVIEEKETWIKDSEQPDGVRAAGESMPAIQFRFWKEDTGNGPGTGKTLYYRYSQKDPSFQDHWEIIYDW